MKNNNKIDLLLIIIRNENNNNIDLLVIIIRNEK